MITIEKIPPPEPPKPPSTYNIMGLTEKQMYYIAALSGASISPDPETAQLFDMLYCAGFGGQIVAANPFRIGSHYPVKVVFKQS